MGVETRTPLFLPDGKLELSQRSNVSLIVACCQQTAAAAAAAAAKSLQSCPTVRHHRRQPTRLLCPWDSPGKNTGVGCHFLPQCMKVKSESEIAQSCLTLSDPMDWSPPGSSIHGIFQARVLEWGATAFSCQQTSEWLNNFLDERCRVADEAVTQHMPLIMS